MKITPDQISSFHRDGYLILKSFYDLEKDIKPIQESIYKIIGLVIHKYDLPIKRRQFSTISFDDGYNEIIKINRGIGSEVYDAVKQIPAFIKLLSSDAHQSLFVQLYKDSFPGIAANGYGIRIDNPGEEKFRAKWHQEYLSQLRSLEAFTIWSPLIAVTTQMGPVELCPKSHKQGVLACELGERSRDAYALSIVDEEKQVSKYSMISPLLNVGDILLIDWLTLHRSGKNVTNRSRWSMQMRYFNYKNEHAIDLGWCGSFASGVDVSKIVPEHIVK